MSMLMCRHRVVIVSCRIRARLTQHTNKSTVKRSCLARKSAEEVPSHEIKDILHKFFFAQVIF